MGKIRNRYTTSRKYLFIVCLLFTMLILTGLLLTKQNKIITEQISSHAIPVSVNDIRPLLIGQTVPDVELQTVDGKAFNFKRELAEKPAVLIFYRGGWCPYCNVHLGQLQTIELQLQELGYRIIAISPDKPELLKKSKEVGEFSYLLLSDSEMKAAKAFGIAFRVDDETLKKYEEYGIDLEAASGEAHHLLPVPAVFIIGADGHVRFSYANPDYKIRLAPDILLDAAKAVKVDDNLRKKIR